MALSKILQGAGPTHSSQVGYIEPMPVVPEGLQMSFEKIDIDSGLDSPYRVVHANGQNTKKELEQKTSHQSGLSSHISSDQGIHFTAHNVKQWAAR